jgi:predicted ester cyclase
VVVYRSLFDYKRTLGPKGILVMIGGSVPRIFQIMLTAPLIKRSKKLVILAHKPNPKDLIYINDLFEAGKVNLEVFDEFFAPDYAYYFPSNTQEPMSLEETRKLVKTHLNSFPDFNWNIEELFAKKNTVIARVSSTGTFTREYQGIPPTGDKIENSAIFIVRIEKGMVVEEREEVDILNVMQQLGMELKPKED